MVCSECGATIKSPLRKAFEELNQDRTLDLYTAIDGQDVYAVYAISGGISVRYVAYLIRAIPGVRAKVLPFWVSNDPQKDVRGALFRFDLKASEVDMNGGDMGLPEES